MKEQYITIVGFNHYYGAAPFQVGKKVKCVKEPENPYDTEAIRVEMKHIGKIGYVANSCYTVAAGTKSAGRIAHKVKKTFKAEVMFITRSKVICRVVEGFKEKKGSTEKSGEGTAADGQVKETYKGKGTLREKCFGENGVFWDDEELLMKALSDADKENYLVLYRENSALSGAPASFDFKSFTEYVYSRLSNEDEVNISVYRKNDSTYIGNVRLKDLQSSTPELGIDIVGAYRRQGYAAKIVNHSSLK